MSEHAWFLSLKLTIGFFFLFGICSPKKKSEKWSLLFTLHCSWHCKLPVYVLFFTYTWHIDNDEKYYSARAKDTAKILGWKKQPHTQRKQNSKGRRVHFVHLYGFPLSNLPHDVCHTVVDKPFRQIFYEQSITSQKREAHSKEIYFISKQQINSYLLTH